MKKFLFTPMVVLCCICISCNNNTGGLSEKAKKNLDAAHGVQQCFEKKDFSKMGDYFAEDGVDHAGEKGDVKGLANMKVEFEKWAASTENDKSEIIKEMADDEYVMSWVHYTGTIKTGQMGYKAGDNYDMKVLEIAKFKDGKAVEHWSLMEPGDVMKMMSKMQPQMTLPTGADSTKKM